MKSRPALAAGLIALAFLAAASFAIPFDASLAYLKELAARSPTGAGLLLAFLMFAATVLAPVALLPALPAAAVLIGPAAAALWSVLGWTAGAVVAFLIARHLARPLLERLVSLAAVERYERIIPEDAKFWWIVLLRMAVPVDLLSYALGLLTKMPLPSYALATVIGVTPFSFVFAYLGDALFSHRYYLLAVLLALLFVALSAFLLVTRHVRR